MRFIKWVSYVALAGTMYFELDRTCDHHVPLDQLLTSFSTVREVQAGYQMRFSDIGVGYYLGLPGVCVCACVRVCVCVCVRKVFNLIHTYVYI